MLTEFSVPEFPLHLVNHNPVLRLPSRLTVLEAVTFKKITWELIERSPRFQFLTLDLSQTEFIDSSGIGALVHLLKLCRQEKIKLILSQVQPSVLGALKMTSLDQIFTFEAGLAPLPGARQPQAPATHPSVRSPLKRAMDIAGALVGLSVTGVLFIPIALAIKLDSPGPIFFSQTRCGWMGRRFRMYKFRSMCADAEQRKGEVENEIQGPFFKSGKDHRVTRVGRFLRKTSLDELPQFWNVLWGDMSLVGTRPPTPDEVEKYEVPSWRRLDVKPGMTGEWQVSGRSMLKDFQDVIRLDLEYQQKWSHRYDLQLMLKTLVLVFRQGSGAM
ncbi:MAG: STAS domain-containing protein [Cyanobacteria bacterium RI_101]|nr:STAS domain-containing protein [Cyanobacteria bacterium RI_101]